jgi:hypothetical protein
MTKVSEIDMLPQVDQMPIVEPRAAHRLVVDAKAELTHQVQHRTGGSTETRDISGVGGDLGLDQDDVEWR